MIDTLLFALGLNMTMFLFAFKYKTDKLTDLSYSLTFIGIALFGYIRNDFSVAQWVVFTVVMLWAIRLGSYLFIRINAIGKDARFDEMRDKFWLFLRFWLLQSITVWIVMLPASFLFQSNVATSLSTSVFIGACISIFGIVFEGIADIQKFRFIQNKENKGKWVDIGLWKYSRHPNYFGEMMVWYGVYLASFSWLSNVNAYISVLSPLYITFLLVGVSGIPLLEKSADKKWGSNKKYKEYVQNTSVLIPLPKKK
jgi:steroid 5-alpha reductase family enzyme